jgi:hypothetical protein
MAVYIGCFSAARLDWNCNHAAFAKKGRSGCWKISVGRRRFGEVELNRTSLYWGLLLICILSALVLVCRSHESIAFQTSELSKSGIAESLWFSILERFFVSHVVWTQVLFSSYFFNWAAIPSMFLSSTNLCSFHGDRLAGWADRSLTEDRDDEKRSSSLHFAAPFTLHSKLGGWMPLVMSIPSTSCALDFARER